jgi:hypothetical protein
MWRRHVFDISLCLVYSICFLYLHIRKKVNWPFLNSLLNADVKGERRLGQQRFQNNLFPGL